MKPIAAFLAALVLAGCDSSWKPKSEAVLVSGSCTRKEHREAWSELCSRSVPHYHSSGSGKTRRTWTTYTTEYYTVHHPEKWCVSVVTREGTGGDFDNEALYKSTDPGKPVTCRVLHSWEEHFTKEGKVDEGRDHTWHVETFWPYTGAEAK